MKTKILSVEDWEQDQKLLNIVFSSFSKDCELVSCSNSKAALKLVDDGGKFDLFIIDLNLFPRHEDGKWLANELIKREINSNDIVILTGLTKLSKKIEELEKQFIVYEKPLQRNHVQYLLESVNNYAK